MTTDEATDDIRCHLNIDKLEYWDIRILRYQIVEILRYWNFDMCVILFPI